MKRVLVTGATGFIGRHALPRLVEKGYDVHAVTSREQTSARIGVSWHRADLFDRGAVGELFARVQPSHLLHFAWYAEHGRFWNSPLNLDWVAASTQLLRAFQQQGGRRIVTAGTCAEYGRCDTPCVEDRSPLQPATVYGTSKHALQLLTTAFASQQELSSAWGRIFFLFGPDEHPNRLVPSVVRALLDDRPALCSHGAQLRDFLPVEDVAGAFVDLLDSEVAGAVNIGSGVATRLSDVVDEIARQLGRAHLVQYGALPAPAGEYPAIVADATRLFHDVGWRPTRSLSDSLSAMINWYSTPAAAARKH